MSLAWVLLALIALDLILLRVVMAVYGMSAWQVIVMTNGIIGTFLLRGPRAALAELEEHHRRSGHED